MIPEIPEFLRRLGAGEVGEVKVTDSRFKAVYRREFEGEDLVLTDEALSSFQGRIGEERQASVEVKPHADNRIYRLTLGAGRDFDLDERQMLDLSSFLRSCVSVLRSDREKAVEKAEEQRISDYP